MEKDTGQAVAKAGRTFRAFAVAPLAPLLLYWVFGPTPILAALPGILAYGAMWTYPATLLVGLPAYVLITKYARLRAPHVLLISGMVGAATLSLMSSVVDPQIICLGGLLGVSAGVAFWLLWHGNAARPAVAADGASRRR